MKCARCKTTVDVFPSARFGFICGPCWDWIWGKTEFLKDLSDPNTPDNLLAIRRGERRKAEQEEAHVS